MRRVQFILAFLALTVMLPVQPAAFGRSGKDKPKPGHEGAATRLRIELTGGQNEPIADASVYVKFVKEHRFFKDKTIELNLKTNQEGVARSPDIPQGRILIQVVAPGWSTFGQWYDVLKEKETIRIHLKRPKRRWY